MRRKYSKARRSLRSTPSPSAYMRPSFHWASAWPCSAAYWNEVSALSFSPARRAWVPERNASTGVSVGARPAAAPGSDPGGRGMSRLREGAATPGPVLAGAAGRRPIVTAGAAGGGVTRPMLTGAGPSLGVPSSGTAGVSPRPRPITTTRASWSDVRIALLFCQPARMRHGARHRRTHLLGVLPQVTRSELFFRRLPLRLAADQLLVRQVYRYRAGFGVEGDDVAILQEPDRAADRCLGPDVADAEATCGAGEASVGDQRHLRSHALAVQGGGGRQHLAHAGTPSGSLVADDEDVALTIGAVLHRRKRVFLAVEAARGPAELEVFESGNLHDRTFRREVALEADDSAGRRHRLVGRMDDVLVGIPFHAAHVLGDRAPGDRHAIAVQIAVIEQGFHKKRHTASFEQILGDITAGRFQICDVRCPFEDFGHVEEVEHYPALVRDRRQVQRGIGRAAGRRD